MINHQMVQPGVTSVLPPPDLHDLLIRSVVDYAIYMLDPEGRVVSWNPGAERIKGYAANEIIGEHFSRFYTEEDRTAGVPEAALEAGRGDRPLHRRSVARSQGRQPFLGDWW